MKRTLARAALAAVLTMGFAGQAGAVPIHFDFTGTVSYVQSQTFPSPKEDRVGQTVSGGFFFDTERLESYLFPDLPTQLFTEFGQAPNEGSAHFAIGSQQFEFASHPYMYTSVTFNDACGPTHCASNAGENFAIEHYTSEFQLDSTDFTGMYRAWSLGFLSGVPMVPVDPANPFGPSMPAFNYFEIADGVAPADVTTLPLYDLSGWFAELVYTCNSGECVFSQEDYTQFHIDSVTRGVVSVPEPGTLGLMAVAAMLLIIRRRRRVPAKLSAAQARHEMSPM